MSDAGLNDGASETVVVTGSPGATNQARRPRYVVKVNGQQTTPTTCQVINNSHFQADTFDLGLEAWQQPDGFGIDFWDGAGQVQIEVLLGFLQDADDPSVIPSDIQSLIIGNVDDVELDLETGLLKVTGRDLTSVFIDNKVAESWPDHTASQIVNDLCSQMGLTPQITSTSTPVGKYLNGAYAAQRHDIPMWDLITFLAQQEGFDAYVTGNTLYFGPPQDQGPTYQLQVQRPTNAGGQLVLNTETLKLKRSLTLAKDITLTVLSYDAGKKAPIKAVAKRQGSAKAASTSFRTGSTSQNYTLRRAGLTQAQAQQLAQNTLDDLSKHERTIEFTAPPDNTTTSRSEAQLTGTNTGWDTMYFIDTVTRDYSFGRHTMKVTAKNHQVESQPDV